MAVHDQSTFGLLDGGVFESRLVDPGSPPSRRRLSVQRLDHEPYVVVELLAPAPYPKHHGSARLYAAPRGARWWIKDKAQSGLGAELIANRLGFTLGVGPATAVANVPEALGSGVAGLCVATADLGATWSPKDLEELLVPAVRLDGIVDLRSWARVSVFQSWLHIVEPQVLITQGDGVVHSVDHGICFDELLAGPPAILIPRIPGVTLHPTKVRDDAQEMAEAIAGLTEESILTAVASVPDEAGWQASIARRVAIADWLLYRAPLVLTEVERWTRRSA